MGKLFRRFETLFEARKIWKVSTFGIAKIAEIKL
jgi:hypothetical protein